MVKAERPGEGQANIFMPLLLYVLLARTVSHGHLELQGRLGQLPYVAEAGHIATITITQVWCQGRKDSCWGST